MRITTCIAPLLGLALGLWLVPLAPTAAFNVSGNMLSLNERDFRVHNNFSDASANDNQTPDPNFPGHQGAVMAIWKATVEWGSALHGNGDGDPSQPGGLGSGRANFDATFQGLAASPNAVGGNVHSEISGGAPGVFAFAEVGTAGGWRIRYYSNWTWVDGPGVIIGGVDLQSVAAHEYGHALGLNHSSVGGATMLSTLTIGSSATRSIEDDDIAGLHAIYGAASKSKPRITGLVQVGTTLKIVGHNFAPVGNEVWFTNQAGDGTPAIVSGVSSANGFDLFVQPPPEAAPGDVLVRRPGEGHDDLSNAWPIDPTTPLPCLIKLYGTAPGGSNVLQLLTSGIPALGATLTFSLSGAPAGAPGVLAFASGPADLPFAGGTQLVDVLGLLQLETFVATGGATQIKAAIADQPGLAGQKVYGQALALDLSQPLGLALSNGIEVRLCAP